MHVHSQTLPKHQPLISNLLYLPLLSIYHLNVGKVLFIISNYHVLWTVVVSGSLRRFLNFFCCFKNTFFCRRCRSTAATLIFYSITQWSSCSAPGSLLYKDDKSGAIIMSHHRGDVVHGSLLPKYWFLDFINIFFYLWR